jgi:hypothetical protein
MGRGIDLLGFQPFENLNLTLVSSMKSGAHYTETDLNGKPIGEFNALKFPDQTNFDFRLSKKLFFSHSNIPGEINPYITFSIDVFNIFNSSYLFYNDLQKGIIPLRKPGDFTSVTYYKKAEVGNPETFMPAQYDALGNRLYNKAADFNSDGMVTPDETFRAYSIYAQNYLRFQNDMTSLRSVFFNVSVGF